MTRPPPTSAHRHALIVLAGALYLSGCAPSSTWGMLSDTLALGFNGSKTYPRTREEVDALPYAQLGLRIGKGAPGILVLIEQDRSDLQWISANRIMIATRGGRIVRTVGLPVDLLAVRQHEPDLLERYDPEQQTLSSLDHSFTVDFGSSYAVPVVSRFRIEGSETIDILGEKIDSLRVTEKIQSDALRWRATNTYWLSKRSALIWRSRQTIVPGQPPIESELLKRPET